MGIKEHDATSRVDVRVSHHLVDVIWANPHAAFGVASIESLPLGIHGEVCIAVNVAPVRS